MGVYCELTSDSFPSKDEIHGKEPPSTAKKVSRPGVIPTAATDMLEELDSIFVRWLRNAVAHCSYLIALGSKTVSDSKEPKNSFGFDEVRDLYLKAFGYLEGFKKAVHQFALETSGASYAPNWGPNY